MGRKCKTFSACKAVLFANTRNRFYKQLNPTVKKGKKTVSDKDQTDVLYLRCDVCRYVYNRLEYAIHYPFVNDPLLTDCL